MNRIITSLITVTFLIISGTNSFAQVLKLSREFESAIEKGTRTLSGVPGEQYWTNSADYKMKIEVEIKNDTAWIRGSSKIKYYNNSPDRLRMLVFRSYPDIMADAAVRNFYIAPVTGIEQVQYSDVIINRDTIPAGQFMSTRTSTNLIARLGTALEPGGVAEIELSWSYYFPTWINFLRQGVYLNESMFIAYWYPQIAVYDDVYGWDLVDYAGMVEFYNGFNNYEVDITLPAGYLVWAGGVLQNPSEVYPGEISARIEEAMQSDKVINIVGDSDLPLEQSGKEKLTWKFRSEKVPDFTFGASRHHHWDASSIEVEPGRRVLVSAVYPPDSKHYAGAADIARETIASLSFECPAVPYPWPQMTVFNSFLGGGAMESPMMVNAADQNTYDWMSEIIYHEIAHSYFPFITGSNERRFSWLDEGWATYKGIEWSKGVSGAGYDQFDRPYQMMSGTSNDIPLMVPSYQILDPTAATYYSYGRSANALATISYELGKEKMDLVWQTMVERWQRKHPQPYDFFAIINEIAGRDMNWLIKAWYYDFAYADLELEKVDTEKGALIVKNRGGLPIPIILELVYDNDATLKVTRKASAWLEGDTVEIKIKDARKLKSATLDNRVFFDTDRTNNSWEK